MAPPVLKRQMSALHDKSSQSDFATPDQMLLQTKSSGEQNTPQPKNSADQNIPQHPKVPFDAAKRFMEAIVFIKTPWSIFSDDMYTMVEEARTVAIAAEDLQQALAGALSGTPYVCQFPSGSTLKIDPQT
jgi:hypothetical protein